MIDLESRQDIDAMRRLPEPEYKAADRSMRKALMGTKGHEIKAVDIDGRLRILIKIDQWWYYPHDELGWRAPEMAPRKY